jgi:hypothetical protein
MNEEETQKKLQELLDWLYAHKINYSEANLYDGRGNMGFVGFHMAKIRKECNGDWDDHKAQEYLNSVEAEITIP